MYYGVLYYFIYIKSIHAEQHFKNESIYWTMLFAPK